VSDRCLTRKRRAGTFGLLRSVISKKPGSKHYHYSGSVAFLGYFVLISSGGLAGQMGQVMPWQGST
jgi:hypothetical protein